MNMDLDCANKYPSTWYSTNISWIMKQRREKTFFFSEWDQLDDVIFKKKMHYWIDLALSVKSFASQFIRIL